MGRRIRRLVLQNNQQLPQFPPLPLGFGGVDFLDLLIDFKFLLRLRSFAGSLINQAQLAVRFA
jgi:hypothetical protein